jgi:hypothetical protein
MTKNDSIESGEGSVEPSSNSTDQDPQTGTTEDSGELFEKLFNALKSTDLEEIKNLSIGELLATQSLVVNGLSHSLEQIAMVQMSQAQGGFGDIKKQMAIAELQKHLYTLDSKLELITSEVTKRFDK